MKTTDRQANSKITIGLDLGDRRHTMCVLDVKGRVVKAASIRNERGHLESMARSHPGATVIMEAGTHSPWVSRFLGSLGMRVIVANPKCKMVKWGQATFLDWTKLENGSEQSDPLGGGIVDFALCRSGAAPAG